MTLEHQIQYQYQTPDSSAPVTRLVTIAVEGEENVGPLNIPDESTDLEIAFSVAVADLKTLYMVSDQDLTIETNDGSSADDTLSLEAGKPLVWTEDCGLANPFSEDVTALFATNASGAAASLIIKCGKDVTP